MMGDRGGSGDGAGGRRGTKYVILDMILVSVFVMAIFVLHASARTRRTAQ